jgi:hypothetical protein
MVKAKRNAFSSKPPKSNLRKPLIAIGKNNACDITQAPATRFATSHLAARPCNRPNTTAKQHAALKPTPNRRHVNPERNVLLSSNLLVAVQLKVMSILPCLDTFMSCSQRMPLKGNVVESRRIRVRLSTRKVWREGDRNTAASAWKLAPRPMNCSTAPNAV